ncbi:MarR family winged helix-turn-helix transcriptional regulator [Acuticoccus sp. MNP-M23]|uniref:MarR family winged helix-turn-helix transcriptional regulator n=1 Tax=Acuticoccus sp. MNP-M23 TaxID=3072793 RepID=UPI002815CFF8|nr:MarR family winged helix-turn-helix transcriptional regulator [Acuticoccus sp. MNP-M23]WMS42475.1 MarR family winged helix-turn-helix transcriptional regulator [Acuticoccus sp. MNP-M23]
MSEQPAPTGSEASPPADMADEPALADVGLDAFAPYLINRISARYNADMAAILKEHGLTTAKMRALAVLRVHPGLTVNELAVYAVMEQSTMSRTLDAMEVAGLVERNLRPDDGRVREVALTEAGSAAFAAAWPLMREQERRMLGGLDDAARDAFLETLRSVLANIRHHPF